MGFRPLVPLVLLATAVAQEETAFTVRGEANPGVAISVWDALAPERHLGQAVTGKDGSFAIPVPLSEAVRRDHPFGPVLLVATGEGLAETRRLVSAGTGPVLIEPEPAIEISGIVVDADGDPAPGAAVRATYEGDYRGSESVRVWEMTSTGADGRFTLRRLRRALLSIEVVGGSARTFEPRDGEDVTLRLDALEDEEGPEAEWPVLRGRVVDADDRPLSGCHVASRGRGTWTDEGGRFELEVFDRTVLPLRAERTGYLPAEVRIDATVRGSVTLRLRKGARIAGRVLRPSGPALGMRVSALGPGGRELAFGYSDREGRYLVRGVPEAARRLVAHAVGERSMAVVLPGSADEAVAGPFELAVSPRLALTGTLRSDAGHALANVGVRCGYLGDETEWRGRTDGAGRFHFADVPVRPHRYEIHVEAEDHEPLAGLVWPGEPGELVVRSRYGENRLWIDLEPYAEGTVTIRRKLAPRVTRTKPTGIAFDDLPPGEYHVTVRAEGCLDSHATVNATEKETRTTVRLVPGGLLRLQATPGAKVVVQTLEGEPAPVAALELEGGSRELRGFGPGRYRFLARAKGELIVAREVEIGPRSPPVAVDLRGGRASRLTVEVRDEAGVPVAGAALTLVAEGGFAWPTGKRTDAAGRAVLERLIAGRVELQAAVGERRGAAVVVVEPGRHLDAKILLR
jgi:hypothetical protein